MKVWAPWDGNPSPGACDTNRTAGRKPSPGGGADTGQFHNVDFGGEGGCHATGWVAGPGFSGPPRLVQLSIDSKPIGALRLANVSRAKAGPHGFDVSFSCGLIQPGKHVVSVAAHHSSTGPVTWQEEVCVDQGKMVPCVDPLDVEVA